MKRFVVVVVVVDDDDVCLRQGPHEVYRLFSHKLAV